MTRELGTCGNAQAEKYGPISNKWFGLRPLVKNILSQQKVKLICAWRSRLSNIANQMETQLLPRRKDRKRSYSRDLYWLLTVEKNKVITPDWDKQGWVGPCLADSASPSSPVVPDGS